jgi:hypothetical protein
MTNMNRAAHIATIRQNQRKANALVSPGTYSFASLLDSVEMKPIINAGIITLLWLASATGLNLNAPR